MNKSTSWPFVRCHEALPVAQMPSGGELGGLSSQGCAPQYPLRRASLKAATASQRVCPRLRSIGPCLRPILSADAATCAKYARVTAAVSQLPGRSAAANLISHTSSPRPAVARSGTRSRVCACAYAQQERGGAWNRGWGWGGGGMSVRRRGGGVASVCEHSPARCRRVAARRCGLVSKGDAPTFGHSGSRLAAVGRAGSGS